MSDWTQACGRAFSALVLEELGGLSGHAELSANGRIFVGDFAPLANIEEFARQAMGHFGTTLAGLPDDVRLSKLGAWLRTTVLQPLLLQFLKVMCNASHEVAAWLVAEWMASNTRFYNGLTRLHALSLQGQLPSIREALSGHNVSTPTELHGACLLTPSASTSQRPRAPDTVLSQRRIVRAKRTLSSSVPGGRVIQISAEDSQPTHHEELSFEEVRWNDYRAGLQFANPTSQETAAKQKRAPTSRPRRPALTGEERKRREEAQIPKLLEEQGWALRTLDNSMLAILSEMFNVAHPHWLGQGRDVGQYSRDYKALRVLCAWQVIAPERRTTFEMQRATMIKDCVRAERHHVLIPAVKSKLNAIGCALPEALKANEGWYLHGTKPETVLPILSGGLSERMCNGQFGKGVYLAEDPEKADQYATPDPKYCAPGLEGLHKRLFRESSGVRHPGEDLFYSFVVRAAAGLPLRTLDGKRDLDRPSNDVFATEDQRELAEVPGVSPPLRFHSLVVELGGKIRRFREFVHFSSARFNVEYLVVYRRVG